MIALRRLTTSGWVKSDGLPWPSCSGRAAPRREDDGAHWILEGGRILPGVDDNRRMEELRRGLLRHAGVRAADADADSEDVEQTLSVLHEPGYLEALAEVSAEPVVIPELTPPGLPPDIPVCSGLVEAAREGVRTAMTAAERLVEGARFTYALCRPPGHHAGPAWFAGYCYLNTAAAAVQVLRHAGMSPVGILDIDLHYPNGTAAIVATMGGRQPALAARLAGDQRRRRHGRAEQRARTSWSSSPAAPTRETYLDARRRLDRRAGRRAPPPSSSRSATTSSPATRTAPGPSSRRSSPRSAACSPPAAARLRDPGGRLRPRLPGRMQRGLRHRPARRAGGFRCAFCAHGVHKAHRNGGGR